MVTIRLGQTQRWDVPLPLGLFAYMKKKLKVVERRRYMDLKRAARDVLENVGGEENIVSIMSCFTRVRVELKDTKKADEKKLKEVEGCQGLNWSGNTVQIIFGGRCNDVYD